MCRYLCEGESKLQMVDLLMNYIQRTITPPPVMVTTPDTCNEFKSQLKSHDQEMFSLQKLFYRLIVHLGKQIVCKSLCTLGDDYSESGEADSFTCAQLVLSVWRPLVARRGIKG